MHFRSIFACILPLVAVSTVSAQSTSTNLNQDAQPLPDNDPAKADNNRVAATNDTSVSIGDFIFDSPPKYKAGQRMPLVKAGSIYKITWHVEPKSLGNPGNISLEWRQGVWPDVSDWFLIVKNTPNTNSYDWNVPENMITGKYIFRIGTEQTTPLIRNRTSDFVMIYQGKDAINGRIYLGGASSVVASAGWTTVSLLALVAGLM